MAGGRQRVQHHHREIRKAGIKRRFREAHLRRVSGHEARLHQRFRVLMELQQHIFRPLVQPPALAEEHNGVRRQIVRAADGVRVDKAQIAVQPFHGGAGTEAFGVPPERLGYCGGLRLFGVLHRKALQFLG